MTKLNIKNKSIAVIGGGAAGYFSAISAAELNKDNHIEIFEASSKVLSKVLISGGGRCNVTNYTLDPKLLITKYPRGGKELLSPFNKFKVQDTIQWFERNGVKLKIEKDNRVFPVTDNSKTIADCLKKVSDNLKIKLNLNSKIISIRKHDEIFKIEVSSGEFISFDKIILATGSQSKGFEIAKSLGHKIIDPVPSLFTFEIKNSLIEDLSGVSFEQVEIKLKTKNKTIINEGPLLITHWGLSGPAVIVLSAIAARELLEANYNAIISINFTPNQTLEDNFDFLLKIKRDHPKKMIMKNNPFSIPNAFWERIISLLNIKETLTWADSSNKILKEISNNITQSKFNITGKGKFKEEFVTAGGINLKEVDFRTMESKVCRGLFFAGEILDIDGITGGFNFQAAWTTGYIAGQAAST